jgi:homoserine kinase type II
MAVYTDVSDEALRAFLSDYAIGTLVAFRGIAEGVENSNFSLRTTAGDYILTLYEKRVDPADLPWFIGLMRHLAANGIDCPLPVAGRDGEALRMLCGKHAAITSFLPGVWPRRVQTEQCRELGMALAKLHAAGSHFPPARKNALGPGSWPPLLQKCGARTDDIQPGLATELHQRLEKILSSWPQNLKIGHIHADLFPDNVFFLDNHLSGVIDFYFACTDILAYDIAICLNAWCFEADHAFNATKARALLSGYNAIRPIPDLEKQALPILAAGAAMRFTLTRLYDWLNTPTDAIVTRKDPREYLKKLRFFQTVKDFHELGL